MGKLYTAHHLTFLLSFLIINNPSQSSLETLRFLPNTEHKITFFIDNTLENVKKSSEQVPKTGLFARKDGVPYNPRNDSSASWWSNLLCMQALESGTVTVIDGNLIENYGNHIAAIVGEVQGIYVTGSKVNGSHMMAMKSSFANNGNLNDSLRFFGVHQKGVMEYQISVIGGSGKYSGANGFAVVKSVGGKMQGIGEMLLFNVYLKYGK